MIRFDFQKQFDFVPNIEHKQWIKAIVRNENKTPGDISYLFCSDEYLLDKNIHFLQHDTLTDIITFDDCIGDLVQGNIMISFERVVDNAQKFEVPIQDEILRVLAHGVLHLCGYKDKTDEEAALMRKKEAAAISLYYENFNRNNQ